MFEKFRKRSQSQETSKSQIKKEPQQEKTNDKPTKPEIVNDPKQTREVPEQRQEYEEKPKIEEKSKIPTHRIQDSNNIKTEFMAIKKYSSFSQLSDRINKEISQTKSKLGKYLFQIDKKKSIAEKSKKIRTAVYKLAEKKENGNDQDKFEIDGLQIILDATPRHEIEVLERVVSSQQSRLNYLQKTLEALKGLNQLREIQGVNFFVVEKYGVPDRILLTVP